MTTPDEVIAYWFGPDADPATVAAAKSKLWWGKSEETDREILERFGPSLERAAAGELDAWCETPRGTLALIIVLDQFSRVIHRGTGRMFENDARAQGLCTGLLDREADRALPPIHRVFAYMPLMHAETVDLQERGVQAFERLADEADAEASKETFANFVKFAVMHRDIVARFDRFPHRNALLGRASTPEELEFLEQPNSSF